MSETIVTDQRTLFSPGDWVLFVERSGGDKRLQVGVVRFDMGERAFLLAPGFFGLSNLQEPDRKPPIMSAIVSRPNIFKIAKSQVPAWIVRAVEAKISST